LEEKIKILKSEFGSPWRNGEEYLFYCPKCKHHKKKLSINVEKGVFKCWICNISGRQISDLFKICGNYHALAQWGSLERGVDLSKYESLFGEETKQTTEILNLPQSFKTLSGPLNSLKQKPLNYLYSRDINDTDILRWKMGFCDFGPYSSRIIIPSFDCCGNLNYYVGRSYNEYQYKYKNPSTSKDIIFNDLNVDWDKDIVLVEGVFDAIKCSNSIPLLGSSLREYSELFQKICQRKKEVYLALDADAKEKTFIISKKLKEYGIICYNINIDPYSDVGEMSKEEVLDRKLKAEFVSEMDYIEYKLNF